MINILIFCGFYKIDCSRGGGGGGGGGMNLNIPDSTIGIEIDKTNRDYGVYTSTFENEFKKLNPYGNWWGIKYIKEYVDNTNLSLPEIITFTEDFRDTSDTNLILNLFSHYSYRDSWLSFYKDSWSLYLCGVKKIKNKDNERYFLGYTFLVKWRRYEIYVPICLIASWYIDSIVDALYGKNSFHHIGWVVAHEIGHVFGLDHCGNTECIMYTPPSIPNFPPTAFCADSCASNIQTYYLPERYKPSDEILK